MDATVLDLQLIVQSGVCLFRYVLGCNRCRCYCANVNAIGAIVHYAKVVLRCSYAIRILVVGFAFDSEDSALLLSFERCQGWSNA